MQDQLIEKLEAAICKLADRDGADDASDAYWWEQIGTLAVQGFKASGITVVVDESREEEQEELTPLPYGWASTPGEVETWCERFGMPSEWISGKMWIVFADTPDDETREAVKASGFSYKKRKGWVHGCFGSWPNSKSGKCAAYRASIDRGETPEQARAASDACKKPAYREDRSEAELKVAGGGW